jgi:site-specific recombinase XerD
MNTTEAYERFLDYCRAERHVSPSSLEKYRDCFSSWISPWFGGQAVTSINRLQVLDMRQAMMDRQLSVARQYSIIMSFKGLLKFCRSALSLACLDPADITLPKRKAPQVDFLNNQEIQRMLNGIDISGLTGIRLRALIELLLSSGMRISEALSLRRDIFDSNRTQVEILGKGAFKRQVFFSQRCSLWIKQYLSKRRDDSPWLFVTTGWPARKWAREDISRFFILLRRRIGFNRRLTPHLLRHTYCTNLLHNGADIVHIKDLAGHQDIQTTARYYLGKDKEVRFLSRDKVAGSLMLPGSGDAFQYALSNPLRLTDPSGLSAIDGNTGFSPSSTTINSDSTPESILTQEDLKNPSIAAKCGSPDVISGALAISQIPVVGFGYGLYEDLRNPTIRSNIPLLIGRQSIDLLFEVAGDLTVVGKVASVAYTVLSTVCPTATDQAVNQLLRGK